MASNERGPIATQTITFVPLLVVIVAAFGAWFGLVHDVESGTKDRDRITKIQADDQDRNAAARKRAWDQINHQQKQLDELRSQTTVIATRQETQTRDIGEMKQDIKTILQAVKR